MDENKPPEDADTASSVVEPVSEDNLIASEPDQNPFQPIVGGHDKKHPWRVILLILLIIMLAVGGYFGWKYYQNKHSKPVKAVTVVSVPKVKVTPAGYVFYMTPQKLGNLNFFKDTTAIFGTTCSGNNSTNCTPEVTASQINYYKIGTTPTNQPVVAAADYNLGEGNFYYVAIENTPGKYEIIGKLSQSLDPSLSSDKPVIATMESSMSSNVSLDLTDTIAEFNFPSTVTVKGTAYSLPAYPGPPGAFIDGLDNIREALDNGGTALKPSDFTKIGQNGSVSLYEVTSTDQSNYQVKEIYGVVGGVFGSAYQVNDPIVSTEIPSLSWDDGTSASATYTSTPQGCGSAYGYVTGTGLSSGELIKTGEGPQATQLYELPLTSSLFKEYYANYGGGSGLEDNSLSNLSEAQFQDAHAVIVAQNTLGEYVIYQRTDMFQGGGCGKPVIYLYPQQATSVNVKLGAEVTNSAPLYTASGWQDVMAKPDGQLTYEGKAYSSLYWEGKGFGTYPNVDWGTVVKQSAVVSTVKSQLAIQGLNTHEINDFLAYWQPRLPRAPYVRLSWLSTAQMNTLAPLDISPTPNTVIRVFLDSQGLAKPVSLKTQHFSTPVRKGFTVVEWGGLVNLSNQ